MNGSQFADCMEGKTIGQAETLSLFDSIQAEQPEQTEE